MIERVLVTVALMLIMIGYTACCDDCFPAPPCITVRIGTVQNSEFINDSPIFKDKTMNFEIGSGYTVNYMSSIINVDSIVGNYCDTTFMYEKRTVEFLPDKISPEISFQVYYDNVYKRDSFTEFVRIAIAKFINVVELKPDTLISLFNSTFTEYMDSIRFHDTSFKNVYHIKNSITRNNEINGMYFSITDGLLAFYVDDELFWVRK